MSEVGLRPRIGGRFSRSNLVGPPALLELRLPSCNTSGLGPPSLQFLGGRPSPPRCCHCEQ